MTLGGEGKRDKQYQSQLNFGGSLPISMKIGKENIFGYSLRIHLHSLYAKSGVARNAFTIGLGVQLLLLIGLIRQLFPN